MSVKGAGGCEKGGACHAIWSAGQIWGGHQNKGTKRLEEKQQLEIKSAPPRTGALNSPSAVGA